MPPDGAKVIVQILKAALPRPIVTASTAKKIQYAVRFADQAASCIARDLSPALRGIYATPKRTAGSIRGQKQLDINFSTPQHGLLVGISLKSVHLRDSKTKRYTHNMKRNEEELRVESSGYHKRQPYAVMVGILFLPFDSCDDAKRRTPSSFGSWVRHLRPFGGRSAPDDEIDKFERLYIALYEPDGADLRFFDTETDPPRDGRPNQDGPLLNNGRARRLLTYAEFLEAVYHDYLQRNSAEFRWAGGENAPLVESEIEEDDETG